MKPLFGSAHPKSLSTDSSMCVQGLEKSCEGANDSITSQISNLFDIMNDKAVLINIFVVSFAGYYQPAGPLISPPHLLPPQSIPQPLESDQTQSSQSSASTADNVDPDVMITGKIFRLFRRVLALCVEQTIHGKSFRRKVFRRKHDPNESRFTGKIKINKRVNRSRNLRRIFFIILTNWIV